MSRVLLVSEARRRLPELLRSVARGHAPYLIGSRGQAQAVIAAVGAVNQTKRRELVGLIKVVGDAEELTRPSSELARQIGRSVAATARLAEDAGAETPAPKRRSRSRPGRASKT
jgi:prevent-host-death family protein